MRATTHVVVIGAGVIGCAVAYELARRGCRVDVIDRRDVGLGATQASAGVLSPYITAHRTSPLRELGARSLAMYDEFVARVVEDSGAAIQYRRSGTLEVAATVRQAAVLQEAARGCQEAGIAADYLPPDALRQAEEQLAPSLCGGLLVHDHGFVAAGDLTRALRRAAGAYGVSFELSTTVTRLAREGESILVETSGESISCDAVVLAAGSWSGQIEAEGEEAVPVRPVRGQLLHLTWPTTPPDRVIWTDQCYLVPWTDGSVLVGATVEDVGFDERPTVAGIERLIELMCGIVPRAREAWFRDVRVGLRPGTPDECPVIGAAATPGVYYATGHYRNGVLLAPLTAQLVADVVLDGATDPLLPTVSPDRFVAPPV